MLYNICRYKGERVLNIKAIGEDGGYTTKGVTLRRQQFADLYHIASAMEEAAKNKKEQTWHIGRCCFVRVMSDPYPAIDIRDHFFPTASPETLLPTRRGCRLKKMAAAKFMVICLNEIKNKWDEVKELKPCSFSHPSENEEKLCEHCNPKLLGSEKKKDS